MFPHIHTELHPESAAVYNTALAAYGDFLVQAEHKKKPCASEPTRKPVSSKQPWSLQKAPARKAYTKPHNLPGCAKSLVTDIQTP